MWSSDKTQHLTLTLRQHLVATNKWLYCIIFNLATATVSFAYSSQLLYLKTGTYFRYASTQTTSLAEWWLPQNSCTREVGLQPGTAPGATYPSLGTAILCFSVAPWLRGRSFPPPLQQQFICSCFPARWAGLVAGSHNCSVCLSLPISQPWQSKAIWISRGCGNQAATKSKRDVSQLLTLLRVTAKQVL